MRVTFTVLGKPQGARRHRTGRRGGKVVTYHADDHVAAEASVAHQAWAAWGQRPALDEAVSVEIETWHARPADLRRRKDRGSGPLPFLGKPDADNVAKLVLDALTKAGVWRDDTRVSDLVVRRRYLPLDQDGHEVGEPRTSVVVEWSGE